MNASLLLQYILIGLAVLVSAWVVLHKQFPSAARRLRTYLAIRLMRSGRPAALQALGRRVAPVSRAGDASCGGCSGCDD